MKQSHIVVIGGGIAGTAAAHTLQKLGHKVTIIEKDNRLGGRIHSVTEKDFTFELGAGFVTDIYINIFNFLKTTGLDKELLQRKSKSAIIKNKKVQKVTVSTILKSLSLMPEILKVFSAWNTLDASKMWRAYPYDNQSVHDSFKEKKELLDYLIQPMLDGYFYWSAEDTSEAMLFLLLKAGIQKGQTSILKTGLQRIPEVAAKGCEVLLSHEVTAIKKLTEYNYEVVVNGKSIKANAIVCATTATCIPKIFKNLTKKQQNFFSNIHYSSTVIVAKTYKNKILPNNYAIAYPRKEKYNLGTITIVSDNSTETTLVKLFASGVTGKQLASETDKKIEKLMLKDATVSKEIFDVSLPSESTCIQRWNEALPEFSVGHFKRLKDFMEGNIESEVEKIVFAGDYLGGPFIEGAFISGVAAANRLQKRLV